ncbi:hypothetical protein J19TS2_38500 [Cohnella xylanilytica]|nr:hypothetical protein J19TS2_38500 [Cohnella xylanilytica]
MLAGLAELLGGAWFAVGLFTPLAAVLIAAAVGIALSGAGDYSLDALLGIF